MSAKIQLLEGSLLPKPEQDPVDLLVVAGEHSGDEHAAKMVRDFLKKHPQARVAAVGGKALEKAGAQLLFDLTESSVVGFWEVIKNYRFFKRLFKDLTDWIENYRPRHVCLVDYPGFNLRLAQKLRDLGLSRKAGGPIGVHYYIAPQVWAWKAKRRFEMAECIDDLAVIFPFEVETFDDTELPTEFVGHPFVEEGVTLSVKYDSQGPILLLPGSRKAAVNRIFKRMLEAASKALKKKPSLLFKVIYPSDEILAVLKHRLASYPDIKNSFEFVPNEEPVSGCGVLTSSGTMSLSCALAGIPGVIVYTAHPVTYWIGRKLIRVPYLGIANILLERPFYPEFIQGGAKRDVLSRIILELSEDSELAKTSALGAQELRELLSHPAQSSPGDWIGAKVFPSAY